MKWFKWAMAISAGVATGMIIQKKIKRQRLSPEQALQSVKRSVKAAYKVDGSWVHMTPETIEKMGVPYYVYRGGLTTSISDTIRHYDFIVDATTGTLIELTPNI